MSIKNVKCINSKKTKDTLDIQAIIKSVTNFKQSPLKTISHDEIKILLKLI